MNKHKVKVFGWAVTLGLTASIIGGCSKQTQEESTPSKRTPTASNERKPATATVVTNTPTSSRTALSQRLTRLKSASPVPASALEKDYRTATDMGVKTDIIYRLADLNNREALDTLSGLFQTETDAALKEEIVNVLDLIDELEKQKLDILAVAVVASQPHELRLAAIDSLGDMEDPSTLKVLQGLLKDPNAEIREAAQDAIEFFQATTLPK